MKVGKCFGGRVCFKVGGGGRKGNTWPALSLMLDALLGGCQSCAWFKVSHVARGLSCAWTDLSQAGEICSMFRDL